MAGYGYQTTGYTHFPPEKSMLGNRNQAWTTYNGADAHSGGWSKTGYPSDDEGYQDHVCRPVVVDAEGRRRPLIACTPADSYVVKTETIVEEIHAPLVAGYQSSYPPREGHMKEYVVVNKDSYPTKEGRVKEYVVVNKEYGSRPESQSYERPLKVEEYIGKVQMDASRPSTKVEKYIGKVQKDASRPSTRPTLLSAHHWRQTPSPKVHNEISDYGGYGDTGNNGWNQPSGNTIHQPHGDVSFERGEKEPTMTATGGWNMANQGAWAKPQLSYENPLTKPTKDIGAAIEYLKDVATAPETQNRYMVPSPPARQVDTFAPRIDSRVAAKRYGNVPASRQQFKTTETYTSTIDSREAAQKYKGQVL